MFIQNMIEYKKQQNITLSEQCKKPIAKSDKESKNWYPITHIHDRSISWLGTDTSIKSGGVKLSLCTHTSPFRNMMQSWNIANDLKL